jgi:signal transduction histidine kinase
MATDTQTWLGSPDSAPLAVRVLVVEDDPLDADLILDRLREDGLEIVAEVVADESSYRRALRAFDPEVILSDLSLPGFSGERALSLLRDFDRRTPFIYVSGTIGESAAIEALRGGATDYILKSNMVRLPSAVRRAVAETIERQAREVAENELVKAQRFETLAILAGSLGHDLRNILQPVLMATQLIDVKVRDPEITRLCGMIRDCSDQGLELVTAMMALARGGQATPGNRVKLAAMLDAIAMLLKPSLPKTVRMVVSDVDPGLEIPGNANELQQCLLNLAMNGIQAMPDGGQLDISAESFEPDENFFHEGEPRSGTVYVRVSVIDQGQGMDAHTLAKLFTPFFTTKEKGNGLGLVSCRRLVENHRGVIRVNSETGKGSRFDLYLPVTVEDGDHSSAAGPAGDVNGHGEHVLVLGPDSRTNTDVRDILELYGYVARLAENVDAALELMTGGEPLQAAIVDRDLLADGDRSALARLRAANFQGVVILFGATGKSPVSVGPGEASAHLSKPVTAPALLQALRDALPPSHKTAVR